MKDADVDVDANKITADADVDADVNQITVVADADYLVVDAAAGF